jgi:hypothetical protein
VHPILFASARADDHHRSADPLRAGSLDQLPAVQCREHKVDHADIRPLEAEAREPCLSVGHEIGLEAGRSEVARHALGDDLVVLDDQDFRHRVNLCRWLVTSGYMPGERLVTNR